MFAKFRDAQHSRMIAFHPGNAHAGEFGWPLQLQRDPNELVC